MPYKVKSYPSVSSACLMLHYEPDRTREDLSDQFIVKLKSAYQLLALNNMSKKTHTVVARSLLFDSLTFLLKVIRLSGGDALDIANAFAASYDFDYAKPVFFRFISFSPSLKVNRNPVPPIQST